MYLEKELLGPTYSGIINAKLNSKLRYLSELEIKDLINKGAQITNTQGIYDSLPYNKDVNAIKYTLNNYNKPIQSGYISRVCTIYKNNKKDTTPIIYTLKDMLIPDELTYVECRTNSKKFNTELMEYIIDKSDIKNNKKILYNLCKYYNSHKDDWNNIKHYMITHKLFIDHSIYNQCSRLKNNDFQDFLLKYIKKYNP